MANDQADQVDDSQASPGFMRRALSALAKRSLLMTLIAVVGIAAFFAGIAIVAGLSGGRDTENAVTVEQALAKLDEDEFLEAKQLAIQLHQMDNLSYEDFGVAAYVLGVATMESTKTQWDQQKIRKTFLLASRYLAESKQHGFPKGREADGFARLGFSQFHSGQLEKCIANLESALAAKSPNQAEIHRVLADAYFYGPDSNQAKALEHVDEFLQSDAVATNDQHDALIQKSRILLAIGDLQRCEQTLSQVPDDSVLRSRVHLVRAMRLMHEAALPEADAKFDGAIEQLRQAIQDDNSTSLATPEAGYLLGVCHQRKGEFDSAFERYSETRRRNYSTPIAIAAGLGEAECLRLLGDQDEAMEAYLRLMQDTGDAQEYANRWLSLAEYQQRLNEAYTFYVDARMFEQAVLIAESMGDVFSPRESLELQAAAVQSLAQETSKSSDTDADESAKDARRQFRLAGRLYERLSERRIATKNYVDDIWHSANSYLLGRDYKSAVRLLKKYMQNAPRNRMSRAQVAMGEARLALNQLDLALEPLLHCITLTPNDPVSYRARLIAGQVYEELGDLTKAKALLVDNMQTTKLAPDSLEWRDSELSLAKLQYREATILESQSRISEISNPKQGISELEQSFKAFQEAILTFDDFIRRNEKSGRQWAEPLQFTEARYLFADAHRQAAKLPRKKLKTVSVGTTRAQLTREMQNELQLANAAFETLELDLRRREDNALLSEMEETILRNCYFARGDVLFDMQRYEDAIKAYSSARNRYHNRPESLEAFVQIANCYRRLNQMSEARGTLNQALVLLEREIIPIDANYTDTTRYGREQWITLLGWLKQI